MAVEVAYDIRRQIAVMWDNTTDTAFGPVFNGPGCDQDAEDFLKWAFRYQRTDIRQMSPLQLQAVRKGWEASRWRDAADKYGTVDA